MRRRTQRICVTLMLIVAMTAMLPLRGPLAMPAMAAAAAVSPVAAMSHMSAHAVHGAGLAARALTPPGAAHADHSAGCDCGIHCGLCGVCHSTLSSSAFTGIPLPCAAPAALRPARLSAVYLSPDPYPPRA